VTPEPIKEKPFNVMQNRWITKVFEETPSVDIKDLLKPRGMETQFDAQYT
jgi:hypothetical protein